MAFFFTIFVNVAFLILAVFCLVGISGATGVILVGVLKLTLDIGTDILSHAIISLNKQLKPFNR